MTSSSSSVHSEIPGAAIPIIMAGLGALGRLFVTAAALDPRLELLGVIDIDASMQGRTVQEVTGQDIGRAVPIAPDLTSLMARLERRPAVLVHMTESRPNRILGPILEAVDAGLNVLSAAESMFYPRLRYPEQAQKIDAAALAAGVTVAGTGINPGFVFDQLVLDLASATNDISGIRLNRVVEVSGTGPGDVEHVGFGLPVDEFRMKIANGSIEGHMGLPESYVLLAQRLGLPIDRITETWEPVVSEQVVPSNIGDIQPGHVVGIVQGAHAFRGDTEVMSARLAMYFGDGFEEPADEITLEGLHRMHLRIAPSSVSMLGAAIMLVNTAALMPDARAGLVCALDLPTRSARTQIRYQFDTERSRPGDHYLVPVDPIS